MFGKKRYFPSRGLKKPEILFIEDEDSDYSDFIPNFGVEMCIRDRGYTVYNNQRLGIVPRKVVEELLGVEI